MSKFPTSRYQGPFHLRQLIEEGCRPLASRLAVQAIRTIIDVPADQTVVADRELLRRAVQNLLLGAIVAMPDGGTLVATSASGRDAVELEIADSGEALLEEALRDAFDPSGVAHRGTTGWALATVRRIAEAHGGSVTVANCPEGGVAFTLRIPNPVALEAAA